MRDSQKQEIINLIREHYPKVTVSIDDVEILGDAIILTGNGGNQVIYRTIDGELKFYKLQPSPKDSDTQKWKSIIRAAKIINLEK